MQGLGLFLGVECFGPGILEVLASALHVGVDMKRKQGLGFRVVL